MKTIWAITKRELRAVLRSPRYYILIAFYVFALGYDFSVLFIGDGAVAIRQMMRDIAFLVFFAAPLITAGSIAGERSSGELRFLLSEPISEFQLVLGKALGGFLLLLPIGLSALVPVAAAKYYGDCALAPLLVAVLGLLLLALMCGAAGLFSSSFANHAASAAACSFGILFLMAFLGIQAARSDGMATFLTGGSGPEALNPFSLADYLFRGVIDTRPLIFFPAATMLFLILAVIVLRSRRWAYLDKEGPQGHERRSTRQTLVAFSLLGWGLPAIILFWVVHLTNMRVHWSYDISGYLTLSPTFHKMAKTLPEELVIYRIHRSISRERLDDLLDEIRRLGKGKIKVEPWRVNVHFGKLRPLGLLTPPQDGLVLQLGNKVTSIAINNLDVPSREAEVSIARAINLLDPANQKFKVYFSRGHGEKSTEALQRLVSTIGMQGESLSLASVDKLDTTSTALVIAGPRVPFTPSETSTVQDYLHRGGRLLLCIDRTNFVAAEGLLKLLPVESSGEIVVSSTHSLAGGGQTSLIVVPKDNHPITDISGRIQLIMPTATPLKLKPDREDPLHANLITTQHSAATINRSEEVESPELWQRKGPYNLAVTVEGPKRKHPYHAAIFGDSDIFSDRILLRYPTNVTFALATMTWLCSMPPPAGISQGPLQIPVVLSRAQAKQMMYLVAVAPAFIALFLGFFAWRQYRKRFAKRDSE